MECSKRKKKSGDKHNSSKEKSNQPASPKLNEFASTIQGQANRFPSLSNLDGDSTVSKEIQAQTTALIMDTREPYNNHHISGMPSQSLSYIHHLDKSLLPKVATSSSSAKHIPVHTGVVIKEKGNKNQSS